jgi:hypothetical protein
MDKDSCTYSSDFVICPWCGYRHPDSWEISDGDTECHECGEPIAVASYQTREITTSKRTVNRGI